VRLPNGVFAPYTGIKTNLLFFSKGGPTKEVWYFEHPYPDGVKNYNKTKPINIKEFDLEKAWWKKREANQYAWKVSAEELKKRNYNFDIKNPNSIEEQHQYTSKELIDLLGQSFAKSNQLLKQLQEELV
jgi:type I restriction enzyme M protein